MGNPRGPAGGWGHGTTVAHHHGGWLQENAQDVDEANNAENDDWVAAYHNPRGQLADGATVPQLYITIRADLLADGVMAQRLLTTTVDGCKKTHKTLMEQTML